MKDLSKYTLALVAAMLPLAAQAVVIDNGIPEGTVGHWSVDVQTGGSSLRTESSFGALLTTTTVSGDVVTAPVLSAYLAFVDPGNNGGGFELVGSQPVLEFDPVFELDGVRSSGSFPGASGTINWRAFSFIPQGAQFLVTSYSFDVTSGAIGPLRVYQYFDGDIESAANDVFQVTDTFGSPTLETRDTIGLFGASISLGFQTGATFIGGAADSFNNIVPRITGAG